ncbi:diguanylate cyclase domain-containing protein [Pseudomonas sp. NCHU5208]|uniref:diguanylate cyclase domain-containing protein n=1 Tax=unclassified Pseudomonas TaxID=196821 RepID=UPI003F94D714
MRNILVIEDSPLVLKILAHLFRHEPDLEPVFCASLAEAEVMLETSAGLFFAAIVDLHLPDAPDGESVDLVMRYRLPCIVLSGSYNEQRRDELLMKGVVDYVLKESQHSYEYAFRLLHRLDHNSHIKILIADDSNAQRRYIRHIIEPHHYQILEATDGQETLRLLAEQPDIDLLILDHAMPGVSGFDLVKMLRQKLRLSELIIIGVSADPKGSLSAQFIKHGADDFLRKPFCPEELNCRVMNTLERRDLLQALKKAAEYDALTGLRNRRSFYERGIRMIQQAQQAGQPLSVAMLDIDHFKHINDGFGHASGDSALVVFAKAFASTFPDVLTGRLGGEEFALLSQLDTARLCEMLEQLRQRCATLHYAKEAPPLSFSAGLYHGPTEDLESMLHEADQRLYKAKQLGRARTVTD